MNHAGISAMHVVIGLMLVGVASAQRGTPRTLFLVSAILWFIAAVVWLL